MANVNRIEYDKWIFTDHEIVNGNLNKEKSLLSSNLSIDTLDFTVACNDTSIINFTQNIPVIYFCDDKQKGTFYLRTIERIGKNQYKISAASAVVLLAQIQHKGGIYTGQKVKDIVLDICNGIPVIVKTILEDIEIYGWLPYDTARVNLAHLLFAIGAYLGTDVNGVLRVETLFDSPSSSVLPKRMFQGGNIKYSSPVTSVTITEHQYYVGEESANLFEGTAQNGDIILFSEPMHSLTATGFTILESGANYAVLSSGSGILLGKKYIHNKRSIVRNISTNESKNDIIIENETLVSVTNSNAVADWAAEYYKCTETIENPIVAGAEQPGHVVLIYHPYDDKLVSACISSLDSSMSSFLKSNMNALVGFTPIQHEQESTAIYDQELLITKSGKIELPASVKKLRAVLIGGGTGGCCGTNGMNGTAGETVSISDGESGSKTGKSGTGGIGGAGGAAGNGGNILILDIDLKEGDEITATIGSGGSGGTIDNPNGKTGGHTILQVGDNQYTSEHGNNSEQGFVDTITNQKYATPGVPGVAGGNGGNGADSINGAGESGMSVSSYSGGQGSTSYIMSPSKIQKQVKGDAKQSIKNTNVRTQEYTVSSGYNDFYVYEDYSIDTDDYEFHFLNGKQIGLINGKVTTGEGYDSKSSKHDFGRIPSGAGTRRITHSIATRKVTYTNGSEHYYVHYGWMYVYIDVPYTLYESTLTKGMTGQGGGGAAIGQPGNNLTGGTASQPIATTVYGGGGNGGNGGGGGGGGYAGYISADGDISQVPVHGWSYGSQGGVGGTGSSGGNGAQGCIILYFGAEKKFESGQFATRDRKMLVGANNRRFIV